jgi:putative tryptophan/tyrosine transport system substrate-binding protein
MRRREFIAGLGGAAAWPLVARAQQPAVPVIGYLSTGSREDEAPGFEAFQRGLAEMGYVEGRNLAVEYRWADGRYDRLPNLVADLVRRPVAVIVTVGGLPTALAAKAATKTIPIVFRVGADPVEIGLVASLNRPGGNLTGTATLTSAVVAKRLELLHELLPAAKRIALLTSSTVSLIAEPDINEAQMGARILGLNIMVLTATSPSEIDEAFRMLGEQRAEGLLLSPDNNFTRRLEQIVALAARYEIPTIYQWHEYTRAGGLMSYGSRGDEAGRLTGIYTGRILKGEKPADLPVQQMTRIELSINLKTAKTLGLTVPQSILLRADEVIE